MFKLTQLQENLRILLSGRYQQKCFSPFLFNGAPLILTCLHHDLTIKCKTMLHGDLTQGLNLPMHSVLIGNLIFFYAFPPFSLISQCLKKIEEDQATGVLIVPFWATHMVFSSNESSHRQSISSSSVRQYGTTASDRGTTPSSEENATNGMQATRTSLQQRNISSQATKIIMQSWADTSLKQYQPYLKTWLKLCGEWKISPYDPPLKFLTS